MTRIFLSLGSNVDREEHISKALEELDSLFAPLTVSSLYESEAVGFHGDPFFNLAVGFNSELSAGDIVKILRAIEVAHGRTKESRKFEARSLDIDLIVYGDQISYEDGLKLPRDEIINCAFMLEPLAEIAPDFIHPSLGLNFGQLWEYFDKNKIAQERIGSPFTLREGVLMLK